MCKHCVFSCWSVFPRVVSSLASVAILSFIYLFYHAPQHLLFLARQRLYGDEDIWLQCMFCCSALLVSCSYTTQSQNCTCDFSPWPQDHNKPKIIFPPSSLRLPGCSLRRCSSGWQHTGSAILASRLMKLLKELLNKENQGC